MTRWFWLAAACLSAALPTAVTAERPYVNDLKVPEGRKDLELIQSLVTKHLDKARAATVCIELKEGAGTGVVVSADGLILSAAHVTGAVGETLKAVFEDGTRVDVKTLGLDSECDAAMLRIIDGENKEWPHVEVDEDETSRLGDWVFALGHSGGFDQDRGVVVRVGRLTKMTDTTMFSDCLLIGGDSGGPLFDLNGKLVGIHSRVGHALQENMHVPTSLFVDAWDELLDGDFIGDGPFAQRPVTGNGYVGILTEPFDGGGLVIKRIDEESPAHAAGMLVGDVILRVNDQPLEERSQLKAVLKELAVGDELTVDYRRDGKELTLKLKLDER